jgi:hypothetical protein
MSVVQVSSLHEHTLSFPLISVCVCCSTDLANNIMTLLSRIKWRKVNYIVIQVAIRGKLNRICLKVSISLGEFHHLLLS